MSVKSQQTRPNSNKSDITKGRKKLLIAGYTRSYFGDDIPIDLATIIEMFVYAVIQWIYAFHKTLQDRSKSTIPSRMEFQRERFGFALSWKPMNTSNFIGVIPGWILSLSMKDSLPNDIIYMKVMTLFKGNICDETSLEFICNSYEFNQNLMSISKNEVLSYNYKSFDMYFEFDIMEIKYHKMKINDIFQWRLNKEEMNVLQKKNEGVSKEFDYWAVSVEDYVGSTKNLMIKPLTMARDVVSIKLDWKLFIRGDGCQNMYAKKGNTNPCLTGGTLYIDTWNHKRFGNCNNFEINLRIEITDITCIDGVRQKERWSEYGFI